MTITIKDANPAQESAVRKAHKDTVAALNSCIQKLTQGGQPPKKFATKVKSLTPDQLVTKYFGPFTVSTLASVKQQIIGNFRKVTNGIPNVIYNIESIYFPGQEAYAKRSKIQLLYSDHTIYLTPNFFKSPYLWHFKAILHEAMHLYCGVDDHAKKVTEILKEPTKTSLDNAYAYGNLAWELYRNNQDPHG